ncbi:MAG: hypothetical protein AUK31_05300 [Fibrobacteres bacterium CG2_30_45_31]|nr:MAG: hypothetical protein AUK31_05300 [Fibrobacteres bacterium CG2_30_45_31]
MAFLFSTKSLFKKTPTFFKSINREKVKYETLKSTAKSSLKCNTTINYRCLDRKIERGAQSQFVAVSRCSILTPAGPTKGQLCEA